jgi:hypothetical protein
LKKRRDHKERRLVAAHPEKGQQLPPVPRAHPRQNLQAAFELVGFRSETRRFAQTGSRPKDKSREIESVFVTWLTGRAEARRARSAARAASITGRPVASQRRDGRAYHRVIPAAASDETNKSRAASEPLVSFQHCSGSVYAFVPSVHFSSWKCRATTAKTI